MPYIAPGSSQTCIPRKAVASTVLEQTRRKNAAGKSSRAKEPAPQASSSSSKLDQATSTAHIDSSQLAETLEITHIDEPAVQVSKSTSSTSLAPSSSDLTSDASSSGVSLSPVTPNGARAQLVGESGDAVNAYKSALYIYTREKLLAAKGTGQSGKKGAGYAQFGSKQSGMQKIAAKKALARELNA